jgi:hypothetical protein
MVPAPVAVPLSLARAARLERRDIRAIIRSAWPVTEGGTTGWPPTVGGCRVGALGSDPIGGEGRTSMAAQPEFTDEERHHAMRAHLAAQRAGRERRDAEAQVFASLPGESYRPMEDRHTSAELARRVARLERQVADTERQRDDYQRRWANAEIELGRLRARPRPWWRRGGA